MKTKNSFPMWDKPTNQWKQVAVSNHCFCRQMLRNVMPLVKSVFSQKEIKEAWAWGNGKHFEFHGPNKFFHQCSHSVDCKWGAAAEGWNKLLDRIVPSRR